MRIYIEEIPPEGLKVNQSYDPASLDLGTEEIKFIGPLEVSGWVTKQKNNLRIKGEIIVPTVEFVCSRCLANFQKRIFKNFEFNYFLQGEKILNITDDIRQEIILEYPLKPLCRQSCKGLCIRCGQNLNERECGCKRAKER
jgi:uncharacterized protein